MNTVSFFQSIRLKIIVILTLFILLAIQVIGAYFGQKLEDNLLENHKQTVEERLQVLVTNLEEAFRKERSEESEDMTLAEEVRYITSRYSSEIFSNLQVIDSQFRVLGANQSDMIGKKTSGNNSIRGALLYGYPDEDIRRNTHSSDRVLVRTLPIMDGDVSVGAVYAEASVEEVYNQLQEINQIFLNGTILAIVISIILGMLVARSITKPITEMRKQAMGMARGDFSRKVNVYGQDEIGQLASTFNDMNDRLKLANQTTEEERRKLSSVLSNMSDGVIAADEHGRITLMNAPATQLIGMSLYEAKGKLLVDVLQIEDKTAIDVEELEETGSVTIDFSDDEELFLIKANFSVVQDEEGKFGGLITVISDVTEQEKVERERKEFVSNVSHELRTPLTTMRSYLEALTDGGALGDKELAPKFLQVTQNETERMIRLVNDLLQLSKMDHKEKVMYKKIIDITPVFHLVLDRFEMNTGDTIHFERKISDEQIYVWMDQDKITQVMDNIISNAIKYSPEGGTITFQAVKGYHQVRVSISDQGLGIPREKVDKIFDRFYRADKARSRELGGTGLGLAISKEIIDAHHGKIWATSQEGKGTTVYFTLPLPNRKRGNNR
ncbi:cell wall metabolism sensor histidine kinase WalK [Gracilibacillus alcaliphilus]|uniref:cell wall metabolism sensor histidine kinase WalK n=1 Tax=Gracilibacillus alcaliphilus TaxID=1401441 RepID=UPI001957EF4C|nr:cell wall metabolism sensor histidine kinase WalK [Gracilibacillus alcaliphilus]MBM7678692.1 two-component system sensor histidine kinase VicK [Gracilibacillus alcaliphilus]